MEEIPALMERIAAVGEDVNLYRTPCWVAEEDGALLGVLPLRLWWQMEPLLVFPGVTPKAKRRRAAVAMYRAAEGWIADPERNGTGVFRVFAVTRLHAVRHWLPKLGWVHQYRRAPLWMKIF